MLLAALWSLSLSWNAPILDRHEFRQLQTAVSAHWLKEDGFRLDYETPFVWAALLVDPDGVSRVPMVCGPF